MFKTSTEFFNGNRHRSIHYAKTIPLMSSELNSIKFPSFYLHKFNILFIAELIELPVNDKHQHYSNLNTFDPSVQSNNS